MHYGASHDDCNVLLKLYDSVAQTVLRHQTNRTQLVSIRGTGHQ